MKEMKLETYMDELWKIPKRINELQKIIKGDYEPTPAQTPHTVVKELGRVRLLAYEPKGERIEAPVFLVPSIINKYYIFDLRPGQSLVEHLVSQGIPVYMIDWGVPGPQDKFTTLEDHIIKWLGASLREACKHAGVEKMHLLGYCVGGTFATIYAALRPKRVAGLIALTTPINFHDDGLLSTWASSNELDLEKLTSVFGNIPSDFLEESFALLSPLARSQTQRGLWDRAWDPDFLKKHFSLSGWLGDNVEFPGRSYKEYIEKCYVNNDLVNNRMILGDERVDLSNIKCPVLTVIATQDHIVPKDSATILDTMVSSEDKQLEEIRAGHIGITVGGGAKKAMWPIVTEWLKNRQVTKN